MRNIDYINKRLADWDTDTAGFTDAQKDQVSAAWIREVNPLLKEPNKAYVDPKSGKSSFTVGKDKAPIGALARMGIKNLGTNAQDAISWLKKGDEYNDLDFMYDDKGAIFAKPKGSSSDWMPMDPDTGIDLTSWEGIKEAAADVADLPADIAKGAISGAGTTIGALGGLLAGGWGAIPGAMIGGGASSAFAETLRQLAGRGFGINKAMDEKQIAIDAGLGALTAPIVGTGVGNNFISQSMAKGSPKLAQVLRSVIGKDMPAAELATKSVADLLKEAGKKAKIGGLLPASLATTGSAWKGIASRLSTARPETIQTMADVPDTIVKYTTEIPDIATDVGSQVMGQVKKQKGAVQGAIESALGGAKIRTKPLMDKFFDTFSAVEKDYAKARPGSQVKSELDDLLMQLRELGLDTLHLTGKKNNGSVDAAGYAKIKQQLKEMADYGATQGRDGSPVTDAMKAKLQRIGADLDRAFDASAKQQVPALAPALNSWGQISQVERDMTRLLNRKPRGMSPVLDPYKVEGQFASGGSIPVERFMQTANPEDYAKYMGARDKLTANVDYHSIGNAYMPPGITGVTNEAMPGKKGSVTALISSLWPGKPIAKIGAAGLRAGQGTANMIRNQAPYMMSPTNEIIGNSMFPPDTGTQSDREKVRLELELEQLLKGGK